MTAKPRRETAKNSPGSDLLRRLQGLLYEYHDMGRFEEARPHILWLMEIAETEVNTPNVPRHQLRTAQARSDR